MSSKPLMVDLFCGLGGWAEGALAEGWDVVGFDIERHVYDEHRYPAQLVVQDVLTLDGAQFRDADLIVASPPCQAYSYMAMPWRRAKAIAAALRGEGKFPEGYKGSHTVADLNRLFDACFRIQREACAAAGRHIPMVVENVKGAQPWVGRARWNFGSFYLWGDVPALMPPTFKAQKNPGFRFDGSGRSFQSESVKNAGGSWFNIAHNTTSGCAQNARDELVKSLGVKQRGSGHAWFDKALDERRKNPDGRKNGGGGAEGWFGANTGPMRQHSSGSTKRKFASAMIAKIPLPLSRHIAATFRPRARAAA